MFSLCLQYCKPRRKKEMEGGGLYQAWFGDIFVILVDKAVFVKQRSNGTLDNNNLRNGGEMIADFIILLQVCYLYLDCDNSGYFQWIKWWLIEKSMLSWVRHQNVIHEIADWILETVWVLRVLMLEGCLYYYWSNITLGLFYNSCWCISVFQH